MFQRIFVPLDESERAERAIPVAARLARASTGSITLCRVVTAPVDFAWSAMEAPRFMQPALDMDIERAKEYLAQVATSPVLKGIDIHPQMISGTPAPTILAAAQSQHSDLIVISSHGDTGLKRWMLGSVAQKVTHQSPIPVLVLHERGGVAENLHPDGMRPVRILVALDGSELAEKILAPAAQLSMALSAPAPGKLHLTHVISLFNIGRDSQQESIVELRQQLMADAQAYLNTVAQRFYEGDLAPFPVSVSSSVAIEQDIAWALIGMAENGEHMDEMAAFPACDVIAMATHGRSGVERWVMGSVTERVLGTTRLPLLIVRPPKQEKAGENEGSQRVEGKGMTDEPQTWVGLF